MTSTFFSSGEALTELLYELLLLNFLLGVIYKEDDSIGTSKNKFGRFNFE